MTVVVAKHTTAMKSCTYALYLYIARIIVIFVLAIESPLFVLLNSSCGLLQRVLVESLQWSDFHMVFSTFSSQIKSQHSL